MTCNTVNQTVQVIKNTDCCSPSEHTKKYSVTLTVSDTWIMPEVNDVTVLVIPNCMNVLPGTVLWNKSVGYLQVIKYNNATGETTVKNLGYTGNAAPATVFPSCMDFVVNAPLYIAEIDDSVTCLMADFVSPAEGQSALMIVKSTANLKKDYLIAIDIYQYKVLEVLSNTVVRVYNFGLGKEGTIEAPCDGECLPVRVINSDAVCVQDSVNEANGIVTCVGGEPRVMVGTEDNQFAYWDNTDGKWKLINSNIEADCTVLTQQFEVITGNVGPYLVTLKDAAVFKVGDRITIGSDKDTGIVTEIISDTQIRIVFNDEPAQGYFIEEDTRICLVDCCDWVPDQLDKLFNDLADITNRVDTLEDKVQQNTDDIEEIRSEYEPIFTRGDLVTTPSPVLTIDDGSLVTAVGGVHTITLDTDLSKYDNSEKHFVVNGGNSGAGSGVFAGYNDDTTTGDRTLNFKSLKAGTFVSITSTGDEVTINAADQSSSITLPTMSVVAETDADLPNISAGDVWAAKDTSSTKTISVTITNPNNRPMNLLIYGFLRLAFQVGIEGDVTSYDGWVDMEKSLFFYKDNVEISPRISTSTITSQEDQHAMRNISSTYKYHAVNNNDPIMQGIKLATVAANASAVISLKGVINKDNDNFANDGGRLRWINPPHLRLKVLGVCI